MSFLTAYSYDIAKETFEGFPESFNKTKDNIHFVGNPVRTEITTFTSTSKVEKVNFKIRLL